jgi:hypothetical protein
MLGGRSRQTEAQFFLEPSEKKEQENRRNENLSLNRLKK